ncbi:MAG TPA: hypothetical protein DEP17_01780 [Lachnospiraceae bacterium]|jgi:nitroreductase|nr:hypothetical protein [Lachnospiraceae bacterium]HCR40489.1 hypothetical protein [Lachnospiraceae bacterium]
MLESARLSPSGENVQGYVFGVIKDKTIRLQLAEAAGNQMWIAEAPVVFKSLLPVGYSDEVLADKDLKSIDEISFYNPPTRLS